MIIDLSCPHSVNLDGGGVVSPTYALLIQHLMIHHVDLLDLGGRWDGCPNAGPEHKLRFHISSREQMDNFRTMLDLIDETIDPQIFEINRIRMITRASNLFNRKVVKLSSVVKVWSVPMIKQFRQHRGGYEESMSTVKDVSNSDDIVKLMGLPVRTELRYTHEGKDIRNSWDTFTVNTEEGVIGYSNFDGGFNEFSYSDKDKPPICA